MQKKCHSSCRRYSPLHSHIHTRAHTHTYLYMHTHTRTRARAHTHTHTHTHAHNTYFWFKLVAKSRLAHTHIYTHVHTHTHTRTHTHTCTHKNTYMHAHIHRVSAYWLSRQQGAFYVYIHTIRWVHILWCIFLYYEYIYSDVFLYTTSKGASPGHTHLYIYIPMKYIYR